MSECYHHVQNILNNYILIKNISKQQAFEDLRDNKECLTDLASRYGDETLQNILERINFDTTPQTSPSVPSNMPSASKSSSFQSTSTGPIFSSDLATLYNFQKRKEITNIEEKKEHTKRERKFTEEICKDYLAGFCRFENIFHVGKCKFKHEGRQVVNFQYNLTVPTISEKDTMLKKFTDSFTGNVTVIDIQQISNTYLETLYKNRCSALKNKQRPNNSELSLIEPLLYHGTSEKSLSSIMTSGIYIPSDYNPAPNCPVSANLPISLCKNDCKLCTPNKHYWNSCHMYGLGAYFADKSSKSDRYVSDLNGSKTNKTGRKMLVCKIFPGRAYVINSPLKQQDEKHFDILPPKGFDSVYVQGKGSISQTGLDVVNSEYILFNPFQCLPVYLITYNKN